MKITQHATGVDRADVQTDARGNVVIELRDVTLILSQDVADHLVSDVMLAIARRDLGSPLLRDEEAIRMNAFVRENL